MKTLLLLLLTASTCLAQFVPLEYTLLTTSTNSVLNANTNLTYATSYGVGGGRLAEIFFRYKLTSSTNIGTNPIVLTFDRGLVSPYFTNQITVSLTATTNAEVWTNVTVGVTNDIYLRFIGLTNHNAVSATNVLIKLFQKRGF